MNVEKEFDKDLEASDEINFDNAKPDGIEKNLEEAKKIVQEFTLEGSSEIKPDIPKEKFEEAIAESAKIQSVEASKDGGKKRVGKLGTAGIALLALLAASPIKAEAGGGRGGRNTQRIEQVFTHNQNVRYRYGDSERWKETAIMGGVMILGELIRGAQDRPAVVYGGHGGGYGGQATRPSGYPGYGSESEVTKEAIRAQAALEAERVRQMGATDREAIKHGRGVPSDARPERQRAPSGEFSEPRGAADSREMKDRAYSSGVEDAKYEVARAEDYGAKRPILTRGRWEQKQYEYRGQNSQDRLAGFRYGWVEAGGTLNID